MIMNMTLQFVKVKSIFYMVNAKYGPVLEIIHHTDSEVNILDSFCWFYVNM